MLIKYLITDKNIFSEGQNMNLDHLAIFVDLAETLNFRKTAYRKNISQPAVSQAITSVENEIGVQLFKRSRSGVTITAKGKSFYENIKPMLNTYHKSVQEVRLTDNEQTMLTIGLTASPYEETFIPSFIPEFQKRNPNVKIFLQNYDHVQLKRQLFNGDCDLIFTTKDDVNNDLNITYTPVLNGYFVAIIPVNNELSKKKNINLSELEDQSLILLDNNWCPPEQLRLQEIIRKEHGNKYISYVNNVGTANMMSKSGLGITLCPNFIYGRKNQYVTPVKINYDVDLSYGIASIAGNKEELILALAKLLRIKLKDNNLKCI